jgi:NAD(P)-dependent dehydrogenase (short-subunit alcohol dehydrogenase family)
MTGRLEGKVAIVTGAGAIAAGWGNGKAAAVLFAREGASVLALDARAEAAEETRDLIRGEGGVCELAACDVTRSDQVKAAVEQARKAFGGRVDVLHNNVGVLAHGGPVELAEADWDRLMAVNLKSMFLTCKHVLPAMEAQGAGAIVNVSSTAGIRWMGLPFVAYSTTKGAVLPFTRSIAVQYAPKGIRANAILPGIIDTPMMAVSTGEAYSAKLGSADPAELRRKREAQVPMGKLGEAWDIAHVALFLASDDAKYITGAELVVDGGLTCKVV